MAKENKAIVDNVRIVEIMAILAQLHLYTDAVDIVVYPDERRVVINPVKREGDDNSDPDNASIEGNEIDKLI